MRNSTTTSGAISDPRAKRGNGTSARHSMCSRSCSPRQIGERAATRHRDDACAGCDRAARHLECLLGVAGEGDRERQRAWSDEGGGAVVLQHGERNRERRGPCRLQDVTGDARAAHPEGDDVVEVGDVGQVPARDPGGVLVRGRELFRHAAQRLTHVEGVDRHDPSRPTAGTSARCRRPRPWR